MGVAFGFAHRYEKRLHGAVQLGETGYATADWYAIHDDYERWVTSYNVGVVFAVFAVTTTAMGAITFWQAHRESKRRTLAVAPGSITLRF